jgi:hypothetical protein
MTDTITMTAERFKTLLEAYGGDLARWPNAERLAAHAYARGAPEAPGLLAEARQIDALLARAVVTPPRAALEAAILARIKSVPQAGKPGFRASLAGLLETLWPRTAMWKPASVFASALVLGALIGVNIMGSLSQADAGSATHEDELAYTVPALAQDVN